MVFDVVKLSFELGGGNTQRRGQIILQVPSFCGVVQTVLDLRKESIAAFAAIRSIAVVGVRSYLRNLNCLLPSASCLLLSPPRHLPAGPGCREQDLLVQVCRRIA